MKILFMGTPEFAKISLEYLVTNKFIIVGVITQPDKPVGRKIILTPPPVKEYAVSQNIPVYQPQTLRNEGFLELLSEINPDIIAVVAYGKIIPKSVLDFPKYGCVNVHGSLLPKYRGAAPFNAAIMNGEKVTGITTIFMDEGIDTGDMILKESVEIGENETFGELHDKLAQIGGKLLVETLEQIKNGTAKREKQPEEGVSHVGKIYNDTCEIDWNLPAKEIHDKIRGLSPMPTAYTWLNGKKLKIYKSRISNNSENNFIELLEVQIDGGKRMSAGDFINGRKDREEIEREQLFKFARKP
jgi:methionyl-tRNA formyltransferase